MPDIFNFNLKDSLYFARLFLETPENTLKSKRKIDIPQLILILALQGYFCLAR